MALDCEAVAVVVSDEVDSAAAEDNVVGVVGNAADRVAE